MATGSLIQMLASGVVDSNGLPIASGRVRFYTPNTLTPSSAYSDSTVSSTITPPLILTAGGTGTAYTRAATRIIVKDSTDTNTLFDGVVNFEQEPTLSTELTSWATSANATAFGVAPSGVSAVARNISDQISDTGQSVKGYGAAGDSFTNDTNAFSAAITAAANGRVLLPPGTYRIQLALAVSNVVELVGSGVGNTTILFTDTTGVLFNVASAGSLSLRDMTLAHSSATIGAAVQTASTSTAGVRLDNVAITTGCFRYGVFSSGTAPVTVLDSAIAENTPDTSSVGVFLQTAASTLTVVNSTIAGYLAGIKSVTASQIRVIGGSVSSSATDAIVHGTGGANSDLYVVGARLSATTYAIDVGASVATAYYAGNTVTSGSIRDARAGAPVNYSFAADGNFTPLPMQTDSIRAVATAAATVTVNAVSATGVGRVFRLICARTTASAVTWTFNAQYILSASVAPANGNRVNLLLEYVPTDGKVYEIGRAATAN